MKRTQRKSGSSSRATARPLADRAPRPLAYPPDAIPLEEAMAGARPDAGHLADYEAVLRAETAAASREPLARLGVGDAPTAYGPSQAAHNAEALSLAMSAFAATPLGRGGR